MSKLFSINKNWYVVLLLASIICATIGSVLLFKKIYYVEIVFGWALAYLNHALGWIIKVKGIEKSADQFMFFALGFGGLKFLALFLLVVWFVIRLPLASYPFLFSVFATHIIFMTYDINVLFRYMKQLSRT